MLNNGLGKSIQGIMLSLVGYPEYIRISQGVNVIFQS